MVEYIITGSETVGPDRSRRTYPSDSRYWIVSALWAQRAVSAWLISQGRPAIGIDGVAGPQTLAALTAAGPGLPAPFLESGRRTSSFVGVSKTLADRLATLRLPAALRAPTVSAGGAILEPSVPRRPPAPLGPPPLIPGPPILAVPQVAGISPLVPVAAIALGFAAYYFFGKGSA